MSELSDAQQGVRDACRDVLERIGAAAERGGRGANDVLMVAVTKYATLEQAAAVVELGQVDLGESRAQQLAKRVKAGELDASADERRAGDESLRAMVAASRACGDRLGLVAQRLADSTDTGGIRWHMIGHLQRNKVKQAAGAMCLMHSLDSLRLAEAMEAHAAADATEVEGAESACLEVLLQVNVSGEATKYGVSPEEAVRLAETIAGLPHLSLRGLMTMAPYSNDARLVRRVFAQCAALFHDLRDHGMAGERFEILSMGMTHDFEVAIEEGANVVRIGSGLFGERE